jgi:serine/threonine protein kinase
MWAVGLTLVELATGRHPFKGPFPNPHEHLRRIESLCSDQLPVELISKRRDILIKYGTLSDYSAYIPPLQTEPLEVLFNCLQLTPAGNDRYGVFA